MKRGYGFLKHKEKQQKKMMKRWTRKLSCVNCAMVSEVTKSAMLNADGNL